MLVALFFTVDTPIGRVDTAFLSQQQKMELMIDGIDDISKLDFQRDGFYKPVEEWQGLIIDFSNDFIITSVYWSRKFRGGMLNLKFMPSTVIEFRCESSNLVGSIHLESLSPVLRELSMAHNDCTGEVNLTSLPDTLVELDINGNRLEGTVDLTHLPAQLKHFYICGNDFTGSLDFSSLPNQIQDMDLSFCAFTGSLNLTNFPESLRTIELMNNRLSGTAVLDVNGLSSANLSNNPLSKVVDSNGEVVIADCVYYTTVDE